MDEDSKENAQKLEALNKQLDEVRKLVPQVVADSKKLPGDAAKAAIDFASATAVGILLGYGFDYWLGTLPWGLLVGLFIGTATGVKLMFDEQARQAKRSESDKTEQDKQ